MAKNVIIGQSGGPTSVINGSLYGAIQAAAGDERVDKVYGMLNGVKGILEDNLIELNEFAKTEEFEYMKTTASSYLGSCRHKLPKNFDDPEYKRIFEQLKKYNIGHFIYIGGNDSMDTVDKLSTYAKEHNIEGINFVGIPKTVDNDLMNTDHTPGFGSAAKYVASTVREIAIDAGAYDNVKSLTIVEIMGRNAGWLTGAAALARHENNPNPLLIYLPEVEFDVDKFVKQVEEALKKNNNIIAVISEGIHDKDGNLICEKFGGVQVDNFGHKYLDGTGGVLQKLVQDRISIKTRSVSLSIPQRASIKNLSATDLEEAANAGRYGVKWALEGKTGIMVAFKRKETEEYEIEYKAVDVTEVSNEEKTVPLEWICDEGSNVTKKFVGYLLPIIKGKVDYEEGEDGLPKIAVRKAIER